MIVLHRPSSGNLLTAAVSRPMKERRSGGVRPNDSAFLLRASVRICDRVMITTFLFHRRRMGRVDDRGKKPSSPYVQEFRKLSTAEFHVNQASGGTEQDCRESTLLVSLLEAGHRDPQHLVYGSLADVWSPGLCTSC